MGRGTRTALVLRSQDVHLAVRDFVEHGILAVRRNRVGEIQSVKVIGGKQGHWISPGEFAQRKAIKDAQPILLEVIKGGYRLKALVWGTPISVSADVLASGTTIEVPFGLVIVLVAVILTAADSFSGHKELAVLDMASLALPFGELWLLYHGGVELITFLSGASAPPNPQSGDLFVGGDANPFNFLGKASLQTTGAVASALKGAFDWFTSHF